MFMNIGICNCHIRIFDLK